MTVRPAPAASGACPIPRPIRYATLSTDQMLVRRHIRQRELERLVRMSVLLLQRPGNCRVQRLKPHLLACGCLGGSHAVDSCSGRLVLRLLALPPRFLRLALDSLRSRRLVAQRAADGASSVPGIGVAGSTVAGSGGTGSESSVMADDFVAT
jgi:hypothetical protein